MAKLTKSVVEAVTPGPRDLFVWDERLPGFGLKVTPAGRRSYVVQYRPRGRTQARRITLGVHGQPLTAEKAREAAEGLLLRVRNGEDPVESDRAARNADDAAAKDAAEQRFQLVLDRFIEGYARPKNRRWADARRVIAHDALPAWSDRPVSSLSRRDVVQVMDTVRKRSPSSARALFAQLRRLFGWCVEEGLIERSPVEGMRGPPAVESRERWLDDGEIWLLWRALEEEGGPFEPLFKLLLLTGQRREEVTGMRWRELNLEQTEWLIPRERSKNKAGHAVDLAPAAMAILRALPTDRPLVFTTTGDTPLSNHAKYRQRLLARMRDLAAGEPQVGGDPGQVDDWRVHDLRRSAATGMAALHFAPHVIEAVLNHRSGIRSGLVANYQRFEHRPERNAALLSWSRHVSELVLMPTRPGREAKTAERVLRRRVAVAGSDPLPQPPPTT